MTTPERALPPIVTTTWLQDHLDDPSLVIVDVRQPGQYLQGHIPGAISLNAAALRLPSSDDQTIAQWGSYLERGLQAAGITAASKVVFYEDVSGTLAAYGVWLLDVAGLRNGALLDGGTNAWGVASGAFATEATRPEPSDVTIALDRTKLTTADDIIANLDGERAYQLVDTRSDGEYLSGTIPTSAHVEWLTQLAPDGSLQDAETLRARYEAAGLDPAAPTVTYCAGGFRAAHSYVVLQSLGFTDVRSYAPSWGEWGAIPDAPVDYPDEA